MTAPAAEAPAAASPDRSLRGWLVAIGLPIAATIAVPWPFRWDDSLFPWDVVDEIDTLAPVYLPAIGFVLVVLGLVRPISPRLRAALAGLLAIGLFAGLFAVATVPRFLRSLDGEVDGLPLLGLVLAPLFASFFELFLHLDRGSRTRAILATLGWAHVLARFFVPLRADRVESMPFLVMAEAVDDGRSEELLLLAVPLGLLLFAGLLGLVSAVIRSFSGAAKRPARRFRRPWLAWVLGFAPPVSFGGVLLLGAIADDARFFFGAVIAFGYALAAALGIPLFFARALSTAVETAKTAFASADARVRRRARTVVLAALAVLLAFPAYEALRKLGPDPRDETLAAFLAELGTASVASAMGRPFDETLLGGYSELDLRGSRGALAAEVGEDTRVEVRMVALELVTAHGTVVEAVSVAAERARYAGVEPDTDGRRPYPVLDAGRLSAGLSAALSRVNEGTGSAVCLPAIEADDLTGLPPPARARAERGRLLAEACTNDPRGSSLLDLVDERIHGATGKLDVFVRAGDRDWVLTAQVYVDPGRLWVGRATPERL